MSGKLGAVCAVYGCYNYKQQPGESKSFFRMPKQPDLLNTWISACKRQDLQELLNSKNPDYFYKTYVVCSDHFEIQCFRNKNLFSQGLLPNSIPTKKLYIVDQRTNEEELPVIKKARLNEENADLVESHSSTAEITAEIIDIKAVQSENENLKQKIKAYQMKLKSKTTLLWKCKQINKRLQKELLIYKQL